MIVYIKLLLTTVCWGGTFIAGRMIAGTVGPFSAAFLRFLTASVLLLAATRAFEGRIPPLDRRTLFPVILLGLTGVFTYNVFFFKGLRLIEAGRASIIVASNPIFITLLSAVLFGERLSRLRVAGVLLSVTGAVIVISRGDLAGILHGGVGWGEVFIFMSVGSWVAYSLIGKSVMGTLSPIASVAWSATVGTACLFLPAVAEGLFADAAGYRMKDWLSILYLGFFGTVLGFVWYYQGIQRIGPTKAGIFINFVPISAITLAFFLLDEPVTRSLLTGTVLVFLGVYLTNLRRPALRR